MRDKFYFFNSFWETAQAIEDDNLRLKYLEAVARYGIEGEEPTDPIIKALMVQTKFTLDRSEEISSSARERGKLGGRPKKEFGASKKPKKANESYGKLTKANESEEEVEEEVEVENINKKENKKENKHQHLDFVLLTEEEYNKLLNIFGEKKLQEEIANLNNYIGSSGKKYKSHYYTLLKRNKEFIDRKKQNGIKNTNYVPPDFSGFTRDLRGRTQT